MALRGLGEPSIILWYFTALHFVYAADNKLIHIYDDTMEVGFAYDGAGNRIRKMSIINDDTTIVKYSYEGSDLLFEHDDTDAVVVRYLYGPGIDNILETETDGGDYLHFADGLGSVAKITNSSGDVLKIMRYDAFGNFVADSGSADGDYVSFTGREYDNMFGLYYYRARYYSPMTGRFTTRDPIGLAGGDVNLYSYVGNGPVDFTDPFGLKIDWGNYVLLNPKVRENLKKLNQNIIEQGFPDTRFTIRVTGGDRYKDKSGRIMSATENTEVKGSSKTSAHLYEMGARAVDFQLEGPAVAGCSAPQKDKIVEQAMKGTAFNPKSARPLAEHGHFHANLYKSNPQNWIQYIIARSIKYGW